VVKVGDTMESIAEYFNITFEELLQANLGVEPGELYEDMYLCIPIAPPPISVAVNTNNKTLIVYRGDRIAKTYPVAVGSLETPTPKGTYTVLYKEVTPEAGYGLRLLGLSLPNYFIHGTNNPNIVGSASTNGNIVMTNDAIDDFFNLAPVGTMVKIF
jgi:lipoprotein-anchoring transpeptidase ErfK/SrfK